MVQNSISIGSRVLIVVPSGPNRGVACGRGEVIDTRHGGIDGRIWIVREADGTTEEYGAGWIVLAR